MELLGAALPNVMFIVGILAIGLGLGIELKIVSLNKEIDKTGRIGAFVIGIALIGASVTLYLNQSLGRGQQPSAATSAAQVAPTQAQAAVATAVPTAMTAPLATTAPAQVIAPTQTAAPAAQFAVPDLHGLSDKDAQNKLVTAHLKPHKADHCIGADQGGQKTKKGQVMCQNPPTGQMVASGTTVDYVISGK